MLRRRGRPPLAIHVPTAQTGIEAGEAATVTLLGSIAVLLRPRTAAKDPPTPLTAAMLEAHQRRQAPRVPAVAVLAVAKLQSAAAAAAAPATASAHERFGGTGLRRGGLLCRGEAPTQLSPSASSSASFTSGSSCSFSGNLRQLALGSPGSPASPADAHRHMAGGLPPRPPLRASAYVYEVAPPPALQRYDCAAPKPPFGGLPQQLAQLAAQQRCAPPPHPFAGCQPPIPVAAPPLLPVAAVL